jgi:hypothetical protein
MTPDKKSHVKWLMRMDFSASPALLSSSEDNKPDASPCDVAWPRAACEWAAVS